MDIKPDTIKISEFHREEISASHADLFVSVRGSSVVSGNEALKKAREVSQLVDKLTRFGIAADDIHLQGVQIETSTGGLLKSSSATYRLRVRCQKLEQLAELLDILAGQKNAALQHITWKYPEEAARERLLQAAIAKARGKAEKVAASLGVKLLGVYDFFESALDEEARLVPYMAVQAAPMKARAGGPVGPILGMDIEHTKSVQINIDIWYRVSPF